MARRSAARAWPAGQLIRRIVICGVMAVAAAGAGMMAATSAPAARPIATPVRAVVHWHEVAPEHARITSTTRLTAKIEPASCSGFSGCTDTDPYATGCWDGSAYIANSGAVSIYDGSDNKYVQVATIYLWYSPTCGTNWAQILNTTGDYATIETCSQQGTAGTCTEQYTSNVNYAWSNQVWAPDFPATAYATVWLDSGQAKGSASG